jgi:microcystin-dependent protein
MSNARLLANFGPYAQAVTTIATKNADLKAGTTAFFAMGSAPSGWIKANGATLSRTTYADLFAAIGTTYGAGDGSTTFVIPDLRGEFMRAWDDGRGADSGRSFATAQGMDWKGFYVSNTGQNTYNYSHGEVYWGKSTTGYNGNTFAGAWSAPSAALGAKWDTSEIRPRNVCLLACIKF